MNEPLPLTESPPPQPMSLSARLFNVFLFWELGVRSVGLARLADIPAGKAAMWVFGVWAGITGVFVGIGQAIRIAFGG